MQQNGFVNPASVVAGRKILKKSRRMEAVRRAIPFFWAARDIFGILVLIPLYFWMRLPNLLALPVFYDETIYQTYTREYLNDPVRNLLISAERDGKPPLFIWGWSWVWDWFRDPLMSGRFLSVLGGGLVCIFIYLIGRRLHSNMAGFLATLFYILCPLAVLHNRLAFHASWETAAGMATLYFAIAIGQQPRALYALGMGAALGMGLLIKQTALFYLGLAPLVGFLVHLHPDVQARLANPEPGPLRRFSLWWYQLRIRRLPHFALPFANLTRQNLAERESTTIWKVTKIRKAFLRKMNDRQWRPFLTLGIVGFAGIMIAGAIYLPLRTLPNADTYLSSTDDSYALTFKEVLALPLDLWRQNLSQTWSWWLTYLNIPLLLLVLAGTGYALVRAKRAQAEVALLSWAILPVFAQIILARQHWFTRYINAFTPPLLLLAALALVKFCHYLIRSNRLKMGWTGLSGALFGVVLAIIVIIPWLPLNDQIINHPAEAQLAEKDRWQYIEGWPSGYAMEDSLQYIRELANTAPVVVYLDQDNVTPEIYYINRLANLKGWVFFARTSNVNWLVHNFQGELNTYYLTTVKPDEILQPYLKLSKSFPKPGSKTSISIYHFVPPQVAPEITTTAEGI